MSVWLVSFSLLLPTFSLPLLYVRIVNHFIYFFLLDLYGFLLLDRNVQQHLYLFDLLSIVRILQQDFLNSVDHSIVVILEHVRVHRPFPFDWWPSIISIVFLKIVHFHRGLRQPAVEAEVEWVSFPDWDHVIHILTELRHSLWFAGWTELLGECCLIGPFSHWFRVEKRILLGVFFRSEVLIHGIDERPVLQKFSFWEFVNI